MRRPVFGHGLAVLRDGDPHLREHRGRFFPRHDLSLRVLRLHRVDVLGRERSDEVDFAGLERGHLGDRVLDHADDDAVKIGQPGLEVLVEPVHHQVTALDPLDELERPAAHHRAGLALLAVIEGELLRGGRRVDDQPRAVAREHVQHERVGVLEPDLHGKGIDRLDRVHRFEEGPHARPGGWVHQAIDAELHGGGVDLRAIVKEDVLLELEGVEQAVGRDQPRLGGIADELAVGRDVDEAAPDVHGDPHHFVTGRGVEIEVGDLVAVRDLERAAALRLIRGQRGA